jgi:phospholipase C
LCWAALGLLIILALGASAAPGSPPVGPCGQLGGRAPKRFKHVIVIVMENHSYSAVARSSPYLNALAHRCGLASNYVAATHPSLPNYLALTSGSTHGIFTDCTSCTVRSSSIFEQVGAAGWRSYEESMPRAGFTGGSSGAYAKKHNPAAYYTKISGAYRHNAVPLGTATAGALASDLRAGELRRYSFITPNLCHDEHDCSVATGDGWLRLWVPKIVQSPAYVSGGTALFITYDEGEGLDQRVYTVVVSPYTKPATLSGARFTHYSQLRTTEGLLGLGCLGRACRATSMAGAFGL